jgi:transposase-like protein
MRGCARSSTRPIFDAPDEATARTLLAAFIADYQATAPTAVATLERGFDDATAVLALPAPYRKRLRTTNGVERLNEEIRRRDSSAGTGHPHLPQPGLRPPPRRRAAYGAGRGVDDGETLF